MFLRLLLYFNIVHLETIYVLQNKLTRVADSRPLDQDLTFIATYSPVHGLKVWTS